MDHAERSGTRRAEASLVNLRSSLLTLRSQATAAHGGKRGLGPGTAAADVQLLGLRQGLPQPRHRRVIARCRLRRAGFPLCRVEGWRLLGYGFIVTLVGADKSS